MSPSKTVLFSGDKRKVRYMELRDLSINEIRVGYHPRKGFRGKVELKEQIQRNGLNEPIRVRPEDDCFVVIDGNRRLSVLKELRHETVPCIIEEIDERNAAHQFYVLNAGDYRRNLNPIEVSLHVKEMRERFGYSVQDLVSLGYATDDQTIYNKLSLLTLPQEIQDKIAEGELSPTAGYHLAKVKEANLQIKLASEATTNADSTRRVEKKVKSLIASRKNEDAKKPIEIPQGEIPGIFFKDASDMSELSDESVGLVVTSPGYCVGFEYEKDLHLEEHLRILRSVFFECVRVTVPGGKICINVGDIRNHGTRNGGKPEIELIGHHIQRILRERGVRLIDIVMWHKGWNWVSNPQVSYHDKIQHTTYRLLSNTEYIYIFHKDGKRKVTPEMEMESKISKDEWKTLVNGVWEITPVRNQKDHPAQFPEELPRRLIRMFSYKGDSVLDPFGGTMTTVKVARELGRVGFGYEKDDKYKPAIMKKLGITEEDLKKQEDRGPQPALSNEERRETMRTLRNDILPQIVAEAKERGEHICRLSVPLKRNLSKEEVTVVTIPVDDDSLPPSSPSSSPLVVKADDYEEGDGVLAHSASKLAKAA